MRISVIIPAYNSEATIADTLASVFAQQYQDLEVIVVDDASSDNTAEKVRAKCEEVREKSSASKQSLESSSASLHLVCLDKNSGPAAARNRGIAEAKGEWIAFLDADDEWLPEKLEIQVKAAVEQPDVDMWCGEVLVEDATITGKQLAVSSEQTTVNSKGQRGGQGKDRGQRTEDRGQRTEDRGQSSHGRVSGQKSEGRDQYGEESLDGISKVGLISGYASTNNKQQTTNNCKKLPLQAFAVSNPVATSTVLVRKAVLEEVGGFDEQFRGPEDYDLWMRIAVKYKIMKIECPLTHYRLIRGSLSQDDRKFLPEVLKVINKAYGVGGCLANMGEMKDTTVMMQYNHVSWMAFCRGARVQAIIYLVRSQLLSNKSFKRTGIAIPDAFLPLLLRYTSGSPDEGLSRWRQIRDGFSDTVKRWRFVVCSLFSEPFVSVHMKVDNEDHLSPDCGDGWIHVYRFFSSHHPKFPFVRRKQFGVSMLPVPDDFDAYIASVNGKNSAAYYARKAEKRGYYIRDIDRNRYRDEIREIMTSEPERQGRPVPDEFWDKKESFSTMPNYNYWGIFTKENRLVGYLWMSWYNEVAVFVGMMGHADFLNDGIMYSLGINAVRSAFEKRKKGNSVKFLMYDSFLGATRGMIMFKQKLGFKPYRVKWLP